MKHIFTMTFAAIIFLAQIEALAQETINVPAIDGLTYHEAREVLLQGGWLPNNPHEDDEITADNYDILSGNGPVFWEMGYHELERCFGNGFVTCSFLFENDQKAVLEVVTKGREVKGSSKFKARVESWSLSGLKSIQEDSSSEDNKTWEKPF